MRFVLTSLAALALLTGTAFADHGHDHDKKKDGQTDTSQGEHDHSAHEHAPQPSTAAEGATYGSHSSYGSGTTMTDMASDQSNMNHANMGHSAGHMLGSKTMPADGAVLDHSPKFVGVDFGHAMMVDAITISTLTGEMIELDVSQIGETSHVMVPSPVLQSDDYIVDWRARGEDGHIMSGSFAFTVE